MTMKIAILSAIALSAAMLSACEKVEQVGAIMTDEPLTIVFSPGFKILANDASAVPIQGFDDCPAPNPGMVKLFGVSEVAGKHTCVVIKPATEHVKVFVGMPTGGVTEQWEVLHENDRRISLKRPDGSLVVAAKPQ